MWWLLTGLGFAADAPEISRSVGEEGGVVVLWPRVSPRTEDAAILSIAQAVQSRLQSLVDQLGTERPIDVRPRPERVCPRKGCDALAVGAIVHHAGGGCVVVVTLQAPGPSEQTLVPWAGQVVLKAPVVPFREPPEGALTVTDYAACDTWLADSAGGEASIVQALRSSIP